MPARYTHMKARWFPITVLCVAAGVVACRDFTGPQAGLATLTADSLVAYVLNGSPPGAPNAYSAYGNGVVHADATFRFDVAFDIDSALNITVMPVRTVASGLASSHRVGVQAVTGTAFEALGTVR